MTTQAYCKFACRGFTLVEVLIALTLSVMLATLLFNALHTYTTSMSSVAEQIANRQVRESVQEFVRSQLSEISPLVLGTATERPVLFYGDRKQIVYVGRIPRHRSPGGLHRNSLSLSDGATDQTLTFEYSRLIIEGRYEIEDFVNASPDASRVLAENLPATTFSYFGRTRENADPDWFDKWERTDALPELVRMAFGAREEPGATELIIPIRANVPSRHIAMSIGHAPKLSFTPGFRRTTTDDTDKGTTTNGEDPAQ